MDDSADVAPGDSHWLREWFLLVGNRLLLAAGIVLVLFVALLFVPVAGPDGTLPDDALTRLFAAFIGGNLTLVTVVLSINQLVLSRELRTPKELIDEIDAAVDYRDDVSITGEHDAQPEAPGLFLEHVLRRLSEAVDRLDRAVDDLEDPDVAHRADGVVRTLEAEAATMQRILEERDAALFPALSTILRYNFAAEYNGARRLQRAQSDDRPEFVGALAMVQRRIVDIEVARHYVKTIYVQNELAKLSRQLLYVGVVALPTAAIVLVAIGAGPATTPPIVVRVGIAVAFVPFAVLFAYLLRVATVAQRTSTFVPFGSTE